MSSLAFVRTFCRRWAVQVRSHLIVGLVAMVPLHVVAFMVAFFGSGAVASADVTFGPVSVVAGAPPNSGFVAVSCVSTGNCTAVGIGDNTNTVVCDSDTGICTNILASKPLYAIETNGTWGTPVKIDAPGGPGATFTAVSCPSPLDCTAVGLGIPNGQPLAANQTNGVWDAVATQIAGDVLNSVSCTAPGNCTAVGMDEMIQALSVSQVNGVWGMPQSDTTAQDGGSHFFGVSCVPGGPCTAVGVDGNNAPIYAVSLPGTQCAAGSYSTTGFEPCTPAGSYAAGTGNTSASLCPAGTFTASAGLSACTPAPAGSYAAGSGNTSATLCLAGTYQPNSGQTSCIPASPGNFVASVSQTNQTSCPVGSYQPNSGQERLPVQGAYRRYGRDGPAGACARRSMSTGRVHIRKAVFGMFQRITMA